MKRLIGLFLAVCCLSFTMVQPVAPLVSAKVAKADCCGGECQCDHDCSRTPCPMPAGAPASPSLPRTAQVVIEVSKPDDKQTIREKPSLPPIAFIRLVSAGSVPATSAQPSQVPLFTRHCAFLI